MNTTVKKFVPFFLAALLALPVSAQASPWAEKEGGYWSKTANKFLFGLNNSLFGWLSPWTEAKNPKYKKEWEGFSAGIGQAVVYTAGGLIHLVTFPIPVDVPNIKGLHIPDQGCKKVPFGVERPAEAPALSPAAPVTETSTVLPAAPEPAPVPSATAEAKPVPAKPVTVSKRSAAPVKKLKAPVAETQEDAEGSGVTEKPAVKISPRPVKKALPKKKVTPPPAPADEETASPEPAAEEPAV